MKKKLFASQDLTAGELNAIVKKIGGEERARMLLRGELIVTEGVIDSIVRRPRRVPGSLGQDLFLLFRL